MEIRTYAICDADTDTLLMNIEATSANQAVKRFGLVKSLVSHYKRVDNLLKVQEIDESVDGVVTIPNHFFELLEASATPRH